MAADTSAVQCGHPRIVGRITVAFVAALEQQANESTVTADASTHQRGAALDVSAIERGWRDRLQHQLATWHVAPLAHHVQCGFTVSIANIGVRWKPFQEQTHKHRMATIACGVQRSVSKWSSTLSGLRQIAPLLEESLHLVHLAARAEVVEAWH